MVIYLPKKTYQLPLLVAFVYYISIGFSIAQNNIANLKSHLKDYPINHIYPDPKGFLWVATDKGLVRYDGTSVKNFVHDPSNPHSLAGNYVNYILPDKEGRLWLATGNAGLSCFDPRLPENQAFTNYRADKSSAESLYSNELYIMAMDETGAIWCGGNEAYLVRFDPKTGKCEQFLDASTAPASTFYALYYLGNGQLFVEDRSNGFVIFDTNKKKVVERYSFVDLLPKGTEGMFHSACGFALDKKRNILWIASISTGLVGYDLKTKQLSSSFNFNLPLQHLLKLYFNNWQFATHVSVAQDGNIWVAYKKDHVFIYNPDTKQIIQDIAFESPTIKKMMPLEFKKIQTDTSTGLTWLITNKGLFSYNPRTNPITQFTPLSKTFKIMPQSDRQTDDGLIWMKDEQSLFALNPYNGQKVKEYPLPQNICATAAIKVYPKYILLRGANCFWFFDREKPQFRLLKKDIDVSDVVADTLANGQPVVWLASYGKGLYRFSQNFEKIDSFYTGLKIISLQLDGHKNLWLCTDGQGAWRIKDKLKGDYQSFQNDPSVAKGSLPENVIIRAYSDHKGRFWLGSMSDGLVYVDNPDSEQPTFQSFPLTPVGSPSVLEFREDANDMLWLLGSDNKWYLFNPDTHESILLNAGDDILPDIDLENLSLIQGQKGIWAMTKTGIRLLDAPSDVFKDKKLRVHFLDFKIFERNANERLLQAEINLSAKENYFTVSFSASDFENSKRIRYFYKLDGINNDWVNSGSKHEVNYTNLDGGTYIFRVRAVYGNDDPENAVESTLKIVVDPPFWKTWWFRTLMALILGIIAYTVFRLKINAVRHEAELKTEFNNRLAEVRISALRAQMNPHFIFNCMNTVEGFVLENKKWEASIFLQKFSKLIRLVLENAQHNVVPLEQDLTALKMYIDLEKVRTEGKFDSEIIVDESLMDFEIPPMLLQPFVENAILHGLRHRDTEGGYLNIRISKKDSNTFECMIEDNGIGRKNAKLQSNMTENLHKTSLGLKLTQERLHIFSPNAALTTADVYPNAKNIGTRVRILIPFNF